jgi:hypothetical protein
MKLSTVVRAEGTEKTYVCHGPAMVSQTEMAKHKRSRPAPRRSANASASFSPAIIAIIAEASTKTIGARPTDHRRRLRPLVGVSAAVWDVPCATSQCARAANGVSDPFQLGLYGQTYSSLLGNAAFGGELGDQCGGCRRL